MPDPTTAAPVPFSTAVLERAKRLGTSTLYEAAQMSSIAVDSAIRSIWPGATLAGAAFPVQCAAGDNLAIHVALDAAPSGSVLVVSADEVSAGYWGEILTVAAQTRGVLGLVIDGDVRDLAAIRQHQFPVFARGICMRGTTKKAMRSVGAPIELRGTLVVAGDLVVADDDGVIIISREDVEPTLAAGEARAAKEAQLLAALRGGATTLDLFGLSEWRLRP